MRGEVGCGWYVSLGQFPGGRAKVAWEHLNSSLYLVDEDIWRGKFTIVIQRHDGMSRSVFVERKEVSIGQKGVLGLFSPPVEEAW